MIKRLQIFLNNKQDIFQQFTLDVIHGERKGKGAKIYRNFLSGFSYLFSGLVQLRALFYGKDIFQRQRLGCPVVAVGNLTVGGTGKTPVVEKIARILIAQGRKVAILSRGYKSKKEFLLKRWWRMITHQERPKPKVVSNGKSVLLDSEVAGDEPYMLAHNVPGAVVIVDKNRVKAGAFAIKEFGINTLILDDGFQYLSLERQLNILLIDQSNPFDNGRLLPRGLLREPVKSLKRASSIFITKSNGERNETIDKAIRKYNPDVDAIDCRHVPKFLKRINNNEEEPLSFLKGKTISAFSGIADPKSFENLLKNLGAEVAFHKIFVDHHRYSLSEMGCFINEFQQKKKKSTCIVTTEKDAVRLSEKFSFPVAVYYLRLEIETVKKERAFEEAVSSLFREKAIEFSLGDTMGNWDKNPGDSVTQAGKQYAIPTKRSKQLKLI